MAECSTPYAIQEGTKERYYGSQSHAALEVGAQWDRGKESEEAHFSFTESDT